MPELIEFIIKFLSDKKIEAKRFHKRINNCEEANEILTLLKKNQDIITIDLVLILLKHKHLTFNFKKELFRSLSTHSKIQEKHAYLTIYKTYLFQSIKNHDKKAVKKFFKVDLKDNYFKNELFRALHAKYEKKPKKRKKFKSIYKNIINTFIKLPDSIDYFHEAKFAFQAICNQFSKETYLKYSDKFLIKYPLNQLFFLLEECPDSIKEKLSLNFIDLAIQNNEFDIATKVIALVKNNPYSHSLDIYYTIRTNQFNQTLLTLTSYSFNILKQMDPRFFIDFFNKCSNFEQNQQLFDLLVENNLLTGDLSNAYLKATEDYKHPQLFSHQTEWNYETYLLIFRIALKNKDDTIAFNTVIHGLKFNIISPNLKKFLNYSIDFSSDFKIAVDFFHRAENKKATSYRLFINKAIDKGYFEEAFQALWTENSPLSPEEKTILINKFVIAKVSNFNLSHTIFNKAVENKLADMITYKQFIYLTIEKKQFTLALDLLEKYFTQLNQEDVSKIINAFLRKAQECYEFDNGKEIVAFARRHSIASAQIYKNFFYLAKENGHIDDEFLFDTLKQTLEGRPLSKPVYNQYFSYCNNMEYLESLFERLKVKGEVDVPLAKTYIKRLWNHCASTNTPCDPIFNALTVGIDLTIDKQFCITGFDFFFRQSDNQKIYHLSSSNALFKALGAAYKKEILSKSDIVNYTKIYMQLMSSRNDTPSNKIKEINTAYNEAKIIIGETSPILFSCYITLVATYDWEAAKDAFKYYCNNINSCKTELYNTYLQLAIRKNDFSQATYAYTSALNNNAINLEMFRNYYNVLVNYRCFVYTKISVYGAENPEEYTLEREYLERAKKVRTAAIERGFISQYEDLLEAPRTFSNSTQNSEQSLLRKRCSNESRRNPPPPKRRNTMFDERQRRDRRLTGENTYTHSTNAPRYGKR